MENKIRELCEKIDNLRVGETFELINNCKGVECEKCPFRPFECGDIIYIYDEHKAAARKWLENNKPIEQEQPKTYNIIEALKLPVGTKFKITYSDGYETTGYLEKYGLEGKEDISLIIESLEKEAHVTGHLTNSTYTVIEDKPLSFFEAVEQADKKRFKIEHELYETKGCHTLLTHTNILKDLNNSEVREIMLNAKCYLEE